LSGARKLQSAREKKLLARIFLMNRRTPVVVERNRTQAQHQSTTTTRPTPPDFGAIVMTHD
jgi:hypothetical protein